MLPHQRFLINQLEDHDRQVELRLQKRILRDQSDPFGLPDRRFMDLFRLNKDLAANLLEVLVPTMDESLRDTRIPSELRILVALRFFATGHYQRGVGEEFLLSVSQQAASRCIAEVSQKIVERLAAEWIQFPITDQRKIQIKAGFMEIAGFPGIIGCIDCTHVAILAPQEEHNYINRKGFHSKNVQIICSHDLEILSINPRYPGSAHDSFIWRASGVKTLMEQNYRRGERHTWLIGDSGYPLQPWLLTPLDNPEPNTPEGRYNYSLKITRSCIERCNGHLKMRFRCLLGERKLRYSPDKVGTIVNACAVLHNMCVRAGVAIIDIGDINDFRDIDVQVENDHGPNPDLNEGRQVQQETVDRYFR